jgi:hypothetical protein
MLGYVDVEKVLRRMGDATEQIVLIGGQAIAFWAGYYALAERPLTSKDIDFCGGRRSAELCAARLKGSSRVPSMDDSTPNSAVVEFLDDDGVTRALDFLDQPFGLDAKAVHELGQRFAVLSASGNDTGAQFVVMHPLHCVISRASNTASLPGYDSSHALDQLRFAIQILRAFIDRTVLLEYEQPRAALKLIKRLYRFSHDQRAALVVFQRHGIDTFLGAPERGRGLPVDYETKGRPQMVERLRERRARFGEPRTRAQPTKRSRRRE